MIVSEFISNDIPPLHPNDTLKKALEWMAQFKVSDLPITDKKKYIGIISESDILDYNQSDEKISESKIHIEKPFVYIHQHIYELFRLMAKHNITVMPVLNEKDEYIGSISAKGIIQNLSRITSLQSTGGIIVLTIPFKDYSAVQIANIIEGNDAKILSMYVESLNNEWLEITIKVNVEDVSRILQTFYRYNYQVKIVYQSSESEIDLKKRLDEFWHFLNI
ncbi:MAG: CBS domain-containing protein [Bacteroidia bacterium]|nr:CBS domain-containing protein [Bacteroidia bacterium]